MTIIEVTGPMGSGKTTLLGLAAYALDRQVHSAFTTTRYGASQLINQAVEAGDKFIFFDEVSPDFKTWVEDNFRLDSIRFVLIMRA